MDCKVSFLAFCNLCEHLNRLGKIEQKKQKLNGFIEEWRKEDPKSLYSFIRLLLPHLDNERENYGLKENKLAEMYISALALPRDSQDSHSLRNWMQSKHKDFSDALFEVLKKRLGEDDNPNPKRIKYDGITLKDVNEILDQLTISGDDRRDLFLKLTAKMTANEQKWLTRIILKCLRIGIPDGQVLKLVHPDAPAIFDVRMNLSEVIRIFSSNTTTSDGYDREEHLQVKLFSPFKPMLAEREKLEESVEILSGPFYIEPKLDGERCQLHYNKLTGIFRYFSRQGTEYTYLYGRTASEGSLSPKIVEEEAFINDVESIVLDGEMVVYDPLIDKFLPFGTLKTSAGARYDPGRCGDEPHPCLVIFDIVYYNGQSLLNYSLQDRSELLKKLVRPVKGFFELIDRSPLRHSTSDISEALEAAVQEQEEGLILKDPRSRYIVAHRSSHWIKIKPEYVEGMCDDLDVVIMGAWHGRAGNIKASYGKANEFLCGIWSEDCSTVYPFVKIGSGYNSHEWSVINQHLEPLLVPTKMALNTALISELKGADRPELLVRDPHRSLVIQVKGSQIVASGTYKTLGHTLRFPRFIKLRLDRAAESSLNVLELNKLKEITAGTLAARRPAVITSDEPPKKRQANRAKGKMAMAIERTISSLAHVPAETISSNWLDGYEVMVLNGSDLLDKLEIEQKIASVGGKIVQSPPEDKSKFLAIAGKDCGIRVKNLKALKSIDLIDFEWFLECERKSKFSNFKVKNFFFLTEETREKIKSQKVLTIETNEELKEILNNICLPDEGVDAEAISFVCKEFLKHEIALPNWQKGFNQVIPALKESTGCTDGSGELDQLKMKFEMLKMEMIGGRFI